MRGSTTIDPTAPVVSIYAYVLIFNVSPYCVGNHRFTLVADVLVDSALILTCHKQIPEACKVYFC